MRKAVEKNYFEYFPHHSTDLDDIMTYRRTAKKPTPFRYYILAVRPMKLYIILYISYSTGEIHFPFVVVYFRREYHTCDFHLDARHCYSYFIVDCSSRTVFNERSSRYQVGWYLNVCWDNHIHSKRC